MNKKRRVIISIVAIVICLLLVVPQVLSIFAADVPVGEVILSFYDDKSSKSIISNTRLEILPSQTISDLLSNLKSQNIIKSFSANDRTIMAITTTDGTEYSADASKLTKILIMVNANLLNDSTFVSPLKNGDIVEIFYTINPSKFVKTNLKTPNTSSTTQSLSTVWTSDLTKVQNDAFEWLNRNISTSNSYLMTAGIAGKAADIKATNTFLQEFSKGRNYQTPMEISKDILTLTFCGHDASSEKYGKLVSKLSTYTDITKQGIFGAVNTLVAYDCNNYYVPTTAINSRGRLVSMIVGFQNADGGFPIAKNGKSDVDTTAMTISALASYRDYPNTAEAIDNGIAYLSSVQTKDGGFGFQGNENLESLCTVIVALYSVGVDLDDERFQKNAATLIENLLQYKNDDGGFAHILGEKSTTIATEQALTALTAIKKNANPLKLTKFIEIDNTTKKTETTNLSTDNASTVVIIGSIAAFIAVFTIVWLVITKKKKSQFNKE